MGGKVCRLAPASPEVEQAESKTTRVAFIGNSYLYFNDVPRLVQALGGGEQTVHVEDCLRGGASWKGLLKNGNGMAEKFRTPNALSPDGSYDIGASTVEELLAAPQAWDFVVMNTYSQEAAIPEKRAQGIEALEALAPMLENAKACPVLMPTPAYRAPAKGSEAIGGWEDFTQKQAEGFRMYAAHLDVLLAGRREARIADVNGAFALVHEERHDLWRDLFFEDDFHPSALGSYLEACVIFSTIFGRAAPIPHDSKSLFARARRMLPPPAEGRLPTSAEMLYLRSVAARACSVDDGTGGHAVPEGKQTGRPARSELGA